MPIRRAAASAAAAPACCRYPGQGHRDVAQEGRVRTDGARDAQARCDPNVLCCHGRDTDMTVRLVTVGGVAFVGLYARTALLISREALALLDEQEVMAITAHEVGHDYVWDSYEEARQRKDFAVLQELELHCDAPSVITLDRPGVSPTVWFPRWSSDSVTTLVVRRSTPAATSRWTNASDSLGRCLLSLPPTPVSSGRSQPAREEDGGRCRRCMSAH
jgi:hypothetical protein